MSNYVPHYTKKKQILQRKENSLRRLVGNGATHDKILSAAEDVRVARIRVLRARRATIVQIESAAEAYQKIDKLIESITVLPIENILSEFGYHFSE